MSKQNEVIVISWYACVSPTLTVLWCCTIECSIQDINTCKIWKTYHHTSNAIDIDALTCSFQWAEDYKTKYCQKYQKDKVDEEIPKE